MNALTLYGLAEEYRKAATELSDLDMPEEAVADTLEGMAGDLETKATNVAMFVLNARATADAIKKAEAGMATRRKSLEKRVESVETYLRDSMQHAGISKIECPYFKLAIRNNPPAVVIDNQAALPERFMRQPEPPPPSPDKKAIKDAIDAGEDVPGAHLQVGVRLEIK